MAAAEQKKSYAVIKNFKGLNTKANRTAIDQEEFSWIENAMPIGSGNIKVVKAQTNVTTGGGSNISANSTVTTLESANINANDYLMAFQDTGQGQYVNLNTNTFGNISATGAFSSTGVVIAQYKDERVIIGDPNKGLSSWDGTSLVSIGSVGVIAITNPGSGYTSAPTVTISAPNDANGVQATAVSTITTGSGGITAINVTAGGTGYTAVPGVIIGPPNNTGGTQATAYATISGGAVVAITVSNPGSGYTTAPSVSFSSGAAAATAVIATGQINSVTLTNAGSGYTTAPTISFNGGGGSNAAAVASLVTFATGTVSVFVTNGGTGYGASGSFAVTFSGGGGTGAAGTAIVSGGQVTQVVMTNPGSGYTSPPSCSFSAGSGTGVTATVVVNLNPIIDVATFSGRVWVAQGRTVTYSAAGSYSDFTSVSAGSFTLTDSTLHGNIRALMSANNFLYVFGDDSINVFSDLRVTTTGSTIFTNTNVSASVGTRRQKAIFAYFRSVLFMNDYGIYALVGSTTSKISEQLDGIFPYIDFTMPVTAGQVLLNNILCAAFNFTYTAPGASPRQLQAIFFDKKWFLTAQGAQNLVTSVPVLGVVNLYGVVNKDFYQLYNSSTTSINSMIQTALSPMQDSIRTKQALKFGVEAILTQGATFNITVDSEQGSSPVYTLANYVQWINNASQVIPWQNNVSTIINWLFTSGYYLYKSDAQQYGKYLGLTLTSSDPDFVVSTFEFEHELRVRF